MTPSDVGPAAAGVVAEGQPDETCRMRAVIAHCWTGTPASAWYPDLSRQMRQLGIDVQVPALPDTDDPDPAAWQRALDASIGSSADPLLLVGHSLGALALLQWLKAAATPVAAAILVAPPIGASALPVISRFLVTEPDVHEALAWVGHATVVVSDHDPYLLPSAQAVGDVFAGAGAVRLVVPGRGHFSPASGLRTLPELDPLLAGFARRHGHPTNRNRGSDQGVGVI